MLPRPITFLPCVFPCFSVRVVQCSIIIVHCAIRAPIPSVLALSHPSVPLSYQSALVGHPSPIVSIVLSQRSTAPLSLSVHCPVRVPSQCSSLLLRYFVVSSQYSSVPQFSTVKSQCPTVLHWITAVYQSIKVLHYLITTLHCPSQRHSVLLPSHSAPLSQDSAPLAHHMAPLYQNRFRVLSQCFDMPSQCSVIYCVPHKMIWL